MLLELNGLQTSFFLRSGELRVLDGLSLAIGEQEALGLVGETGSGKSVTAYSIVNLLQRPGKVVGGEVLWEGVDLLQISERRLREVRGREIAMIFQSPRKALNPVLSIGAQLTKVLRARMGLGKTAARDRAVELLRDVRVSDPERRLKSFPHELSGGMAQRVMIALALSCQPRLLIADEPTTGLDVTTQGQLIELLDDLRREHRMSILLITHDLALAAQLCDRIAILYAGRVAEIGPASAVFQAPRHPYTAGLLASRPRVGMTGDIPMIPGSVADLMRPPSGCRFHPRCSNATEICSAVQPELTGDAARRQIACHNPIRAASAAELEEVR
jgi:oligopeptide/dipeptide ABC transporter ATP-binding protein